MKLKRDFMIVAAGHFFQTVVLFITTRVMTYVLSPREIGQYALLYAFITMFFSVFITPPSLYAQRCFFEWKNVGVLADYSKKFVLYILISGCFAGACSVLLKFMFHIELSFSNAAVFGLVFGVSVFMNLGTFFFGSLNMLRRRAQFILCTALTGLLVLCFSLIFVTKFGKSADQWIWGQILAYCLTACLGGMLFYRAVEFKKATPEVWTWTRIGLDIRDMLKFSWPLFIASFVLWVQNESYRFLLGAVSSVQVVGMFTVGFNLGKKINQKVIALTNHFYHPIFFEKISGTTQKERSRVCAKYASAFFPLIILLGVFVSSASAFLAVIFVAPAFQPSTAIVLFWSGIFCVFFGLLNIYRMYAVTEMDMRVVIIPYVFGALAVVILIPLLCRSNPFAGAGMALAAGAAVSCCSLMIRIKKLLYVPFPWRRVLSACVWIVPFGLVWSGLRFIFPNPGFRQSIIAVIILGLLELLAQVWLARPWIFPLKFFGQVEQEDLI